MFGLFGPLVGGVVAATIFPFLDGDMRFGPFQKLQQVPLVALLGLPYSYAVGLLPALAVGAIVAHRDFYRGGSTFVFAVLIGLLGGAVLGLLPGVRLTRFSALVIPAAFLATLACWRLTRRLAAIRLPEAAL
jgi:hypothetical protein